MKNFSFKRKVLALHTVPCGGCKIPFVLSSCAYISHDRRAVRYAFHMGCKMRRTWHAPYMPLYQTPDLCLPLKQKR